MQYFHECIDKNNYIYSCDMVRIKFEFRHSDFENLIKYFTKSYRIDVKVFPLCTSDFKYRHLFQITYDKSSMSVGIGFNGSNREDLFYGFAELNPNKCFVSDQCFYDLQTLFSYAWKYELVRWDLAVDIPIGRKYLSLAKDGRRYENIFYSADNRTEYLGVRNDPGRVKLYNKALEDKYQDYAELTRLELTCSGDWGVNEIIAKLPFVDRIKDQNELNLATDLSNTQRVLVELINASDSKSYYFRMLNCSMQHKLRPYIFDDNNRIQYDRNSIDQVLRQLKRTLKNFEDGFYFPEKKVLLQESEVNPFE